MKNQVMNQLSPTRLSSSSRLIYVRLVISGLKLLQAVSYTSFLNVNRKVIFIPGFSAYVKRLVLPALLFVFLSSHSSSYASDGTSDGSTRAAVVKYLVKTNPHAIRRADFRCPDFTAVMLPPNQEHHAEAYVRCEDWDTYHKLMQQDRVSEAGRLLLTEGK